MNRLVPPRHRGTRSEDPALEAEALGELSEVEVWHTAAGLWTHYLLPGEGTPSRRCCPPSRAQPPTPPAITAGRAAAQGRVNVTGSDGARRTVRYYTLAPHRGRQGRAAPYEGSCSALTRPGITTYPSAPTSRYPARTRCCSRQGRHTTRVK